MLREDSNAVANTFHPNCLQLLIQIHYFIWPILSVSSLRYSKAAVGLRGSY